MPPRGAVEYSSLDIMAIMVCGNCGASIEDAARFCRKCGRPIIYSEATTRELDPPQYAEPQTRPVNAADTAPSFVPMAGMPPPAPVTQSIEGGGQKRTIIILSGVVAVLLVTLLIVLLASRQNPIVTVTPRPPETPRGGVGIGGGPRPVQPPRAPGTPEAPATPATPVPSDWLHYPGSEKTMIMNGDGEGQVLKLLTDDDIDTVADWYRGRVKVREILNMPGETVMMQAENTVIILSREGDQTGIMITLGDGR